MIFLVHQKAQIVVQVFKNTEELLIGTNLCKTFWKLANDFPEELLVWVEKDLFPSLAKEKLKDCFDHDLVISSYAVKTRFLGGEIGYVDQLPFINVKSGVKYPTWKMSSDVGGIKAKTLLQFRGLFKNISDFNYLLNSVSKLGQQNGLFCYSDPHLINTVQELDPEPTAGNKELFSFVFQHYKSIWSFVLFFCLMKYEKRFPIGALLQALIKRKFFQKDIDLSQMQVFHDKPNNYENSIDVIIPTLGRAQFLGQVVKDLSLQSFLPKRVIIVEQQPETDLKSELQDILTKEWPFEVVHIFTHRTGACMARNKAMEKVESEWIFFADDDIRIEKNVLAATIKEVKRLKVDCINLNCKQPGEDTVFHKIKQWGSFGSGTSIVRSPFARDIRFSEAFEHGYGEDADFGMKLRQKGCDIIYHPGLVIQHLKAPVGGFRKKTVLAWEKEIPTPKPSPTVMLLANRYYTPEQMKGFKISLYLKYFRNQKIVNPFSYIEKMESSWKRSKYYANRLEEDSFDLKELKGEQK